LRDLIVFLMRNQRFTALLMTIEITFRVIVRNTRINLDMDIEDKMRTEAVARMDVALMEKNEDAEEAII